MRLVSRELSFFFLMKVDNYRYLNYHFIIIFVRYLFLTLSTVELNFIARTVSVLVRYRAYLQASGPKS